MAVRFQELAGVLRLHAGVILAGRNSLSHVSGRTVGRIKYQEIARSIRLHLETNDGERVARSLEVDGWKLSLVCLRFLTGSVDDGGRQEVALDIFEQQFPCLWTVDRVIVHVCSAADTKATEQRLCL